MLLKTTPFLRQCLREAIKVRNEAIKICNETIPNETGDNPNDTGDYPNDTVDNPNDTIKICNEAIKSCNDIVINSDIRNCPAKNIANIQNDLVCHTIVIRASKTLLLCSNNNPKYLLQNMLKNVKIIQPLPIVIPSKEYIQLMESFKYKALERESAHDFSDLRNANKLVISIFNLLLSVACVSFAAFYFSPFLDLPFVFETYQARVSGFNLCFGYWVCRRLVFCQRFAKRFLNQSSARTRKYTKTVRISNKMASMRDAMKRLEVIYNTCAPEAIEKNRDDMNLDEFTRLRKQVHQNLRQVRLQLKERESMMKNGSTTSGSAEASYRIRVAIKSVKEQVSKMQDMVDKEARKKKNAIDIDDKKQIVELCKQHIEECENLEKRKGLESHVNDRIELLHISGNSNKNTADPEIFTHTDLPDIDVEEDFKVINNKNKDIDDDLDYISKGVQDLKNIAIDMGQELDDQNQKLEAIDKKVENALDHTDNLNVALKKSLDGAMKGDKFMVNCILMCVLLALVAFISAQFLQQ